MYKKLMCDMDKATLLNMRDGGMSNAEIAVSVGCSKATIYKLIGKQPEDISKRARNAGYARAWEARRKPAEGGYTTERKMQSFMPKREEAEPASAVLVMKPVKMPIPLRGEFMHYVISPDRDLIDVETEGGRALIQIPAEKLDTFIAELNAIKKNIGAAQPMPFWG